MMEDWGVEEAHQGMYAVRVLIYGFLVLDIYSWAVEAHLHRLQEKNSLLQISFIYVHCEKQFISHFISLALNCKSSPAVFDIL